MNMSLSVCGRHGGEARPPLPVIRGAKAAMGDVENVPRIASFRP